MFEKLYARAQDPDDTMVSSSFKWRSFGDMPARLKFNMDEIGSDTNKGRKKKVAGDQFYISCCRSCVVVVSHTD